MALVAFAGCEDVCAFSVEEIVLPLPNVGIVVGVEVNASSMSEFSFQLAFVTRSVNVLLRYLARKVPHVDEELLDNLFSLSKHSALFFFNVHITTVLYCYRGSLDNQRSTLSAFILRQLKLLLPRLLIH